MIRMKTIDKVTSRDVSFYVRGRREERGKDLEWDEWSRRGIADEEKSEIEKPMI